MCTGISVYGGALTRGNVYQVVDEDAAKGQLRIEGDNGRTRWFPASVFADEGTPVATMCSFVVDGPIDDPRNDIVEVSIDLSDGTRRWCIFATPQRLTEGGELVNGTQIRYHYRNAHVIIAEELSEALIGLILREIDNQGDLESCTLPLNET